MGVVGKAITDCRLNNIVSLTAFLRTDKVLMRDPDMGPPYPEVGVRSYLAIQLIERIVLEEVLL